jgi:hypothetical protein
MAGVVVVGSSAAVDEGVRKLKAAGCEVSRVNPEKGLDKKGWQVKDPEIKAADVVVLDRDYASDDVLRRIQSIGTPYVVVGADGLTWSACLRPTIAILRGDSNRRVTESTSTVEEEAGGALKE